MDNEPYRDLTHGEIADAVASKLIAEGHGVAREYRLPSGKIADIIVRRTDGHIDIIEVKDRLYSALIVEASRKYWSWCNHLWIASTHALFAPQKSNLWSLLWQDPSEKVGLIQVSREGIFCVREAAAHTLHQGFRGRLERGIPNPCSEGEGGLLV